LLSFCKRDIQKSITATEDLRFVFYALLLEISKRKALLLTPVPWWQRSKDAIKREKWLSFLYEIYGTSMSLKFPNSGARGAPWVSKFGNLLIRKLLVLTSAYARTPAWHTLGEGEGNPKTTQPGEAECDLLVRNSQHFSLSNSSVFYSKSKNLDYCILSLSCFFQSRLFFLSTAYWVVLTN